MQLSMLAIEKVEYPAYHIHKRQSQMKVTALKTMIQFDVQFSLLIEQAFESQNEQLR